MKKIMGFVEETITPYTQYVAKLHIMADVPSRKVTPRRFHSETREMFPFNLKHLSYLRIENPEHLALNTFMNILTALLRDGLGHTRISECLCVMLFKL